MYRLIWVVLVLFVDLSCKEGNRNKNLTVHEKLLAQVRERLYKNRQEKSDNLIKMVDTLDLNKKEWAYYYLTFGFLYLKTGQSKKSFEYLEKAKFSIAKIKLKKIEAEANLIWGLIYEDTHLLNEATLSFFKAMDYYQQNSTSPEYFFSLLGLARTAPEKNHFIEKPADYFSRYPTEVNEILFYKTKAYITDDIQQKNKLLLRILEIESKTDNSRGELDLSSTLALNRQLLSNNDTTNYYLKTVTRIPKQNSSLVHYYHTKTYDGMNSGRFSEEMSKNDSTIQYSTDQPVVLAQVHYRKSNIEMMQKNLASANTSLLLDKKDEKIQLKTVQDKQIALMTIQYQLKQMEIELLELRNFWQAIILSTLIVACIVGLLFVYHWRKAELKIQTLMELINNNGSIRYELEKKYQMTRNKLLLLANERQEVTQDVEMVDGITENFKNWDHFRSNVIYRNPLFFDKLKKKHPELSAVNIRYCLCIYSRLSNTQTADLLCVSYDAVKKAKRKLKDVFRLDTVQKLARYLQAIDQEIVDYADNKSA